MKKVIINKPVVLVLFILLFPLISFSEELVDTICKRKERFTEILKEFVQVEERQTIIMDEKENVVKEELMIFEKFWSQNKWMRKTIKKVSKGVTHEQKTIKIEKEDRVLFPFNLKDRTYYEFKVKEETFFIKIIANLKSEYREKKALEGEFIISKETKYIEKAFLILSRFHLILQPTKIIITYSKVDDELIAPKTVETETMTKRILGVRRIVRVKSNFSYKKVT